MAEAGDGSGHTPLTPEWTPAPHASYCPWQGDRPAAAPSFVTVSMLISGQLCAAQWSVTPCLSTNPLSSTPQAKVVCRMPTVDRMCILVHYIHTVDLLPVLRPPGWPCNAGLVSCQRVWSVHCYSSLPGQRVHVMSVSERLLTEWIEC